MRICVLGIFRDFEPAENATKKCNTHWRLGHVIHACTSSLQPDQLAMRIKYTEIDGVKILNHLQRAFNATQPKAEDEVATYETLQVRAASNHSVFLCCCTTIEPSLDIYGCCCHAGLLIDDAQCPP